jgi:hypothetical protein
VTVPVGSKLDSLLTVARNCPREQDPVLAMAESETREPAFAAAVTAIVMLTGPAGAYVALPL